MKLRRSPIMQIQRNDELRYIDIWLRTEEPTPDLTDIRQRFPNYDIVVWHSGHCVLAELSGQLLKVNC